jgi:uncharacterized membrane protein YczE
MKKKELLRRYLTYIAGLYILAMGLALIITSSLGTSPISTWAYVMSRNTPLSVGTYTFIINMVLILGQCLVLRHRGLRKQLVNIALQVPFSFVFSTFIDLNLWLVEPLGSAHYALCLLLLLLGCLVQSVGVVFEVKAGVTMMSAEALVYYVCYRFQREFGKVKVRFDVGMVLFALLCSLCFHPNLQGVLTAVREGTVIAALCVGQIVRFISPRMEWITRWCQK